MLRRLAISDFVIVDRLELEFEAGFGALTGETGAGKSILLDALGLALGGRSEAGMVRDGASRAQVVAEFELASDSPLQGWLQTQELPDEEGRLIVRRTVDPGGRSRAWLNGTQVGLTQLREIGPWLADIHGQHAHHALLRPEAQRALLDSHAGLEALAADVRARHQAWRALSEARASAEADQASLAHERELLGWQVKELDELAFEPAAWQELNAEHARLGHAAGLLEGADLALAALGEGDLAVAGQLEGLSARFAELAGYDPELGAVQELLQSAAIQVDEALHQLRRYRSRLELDPQRLAEVDARIAAVTDLARKYRVAPEGLPDRLAQLRERLERLETQTDPALLARREAEARQAYEACAGELSRRRQPAAQALSQAVTASMQQLAMVGGRFEVALLPLERGGAQGLEAVEFQVAANPGQSLRPLARVASGGELSRIGLAIQVITSRSTAAPTLIFDEVDVGIGGGVAEIVGRLLRQLGEDRQVMCVTHLPQVAAQARWQWRIAKAEEDGQTRSRVAVLDERGRVDEIARMLGGVNITEKTREHAAEMLGRPQA